MFKPTPWTSTLKCEPCLTIKSISIFSQNIHKNKLLTNIILEVQRTFNIIFIQELLWSSISSYSNRESNELVGIPNYSNWIIFFRNPSNSNDSPRAITYINIWLINLHFILHNDIFNCKDISCISFFNCSFIYFLLNVYFDSSQLALKYLKDTEVNINNVLIITDDFNIRNSS